MSLCSPTLAYLALLPFPSPDLPTSILVLLLTPRLVIATGLQWPERTGRRMSFRVGLCLLGFKIGSWGWGGEGGKEGHAPDGGLKLSA